VIELSEVICEVKELKKHFPVLGGVFLREVARVHAIDGISFDILKGETMGLVGESGCGKTTTGRVILGMLPPTDGNVKVMGQDLFTLPKEQARSIRKELGVIFQDPFSSLNPRRTVLEIIGEPLETHKLAKGREKKRIVAELLNKVGLNPNHLSRYPHEFSGGQKQRIAIARALASNPKFVVADEPVAALDVSLRAGILNLIRNLQREFELTYLFISHDLSVVKHMSTRIAIMYLGKIVELAQTDELFDDPLHPYTKALISAIPIPDPTVKRDRIILSGDVPSPINPPKGCRFHPRCNLFTEKCKEVEPEIIEIRKGHYVACHLIK
jgi:oligopeptide transport system ATP-binding protein